MSRGKDAASDFMSDGGGQRRKGGSKAMQAARQSIHQYENDLESQKSGKRRKPTKGAPVLQDAVNRQGSRFSDVQSEDSLAYIQNESLHRGATKHGHHHKPQYFNDEQPSQYLQSIDEGDSQKSDENSDVGGRDAHRQKKGGKNVRNGGNKTSQRSSK